MYKIHRIFFTVSKKTNFITVVCHITSSYIFICLSVSFCDRCHTTGSGGSATATVSDSLQAYTLVLEDNPLNAFVELPEKYKELWSGLWGTPVYPSVFWAFFFLISHSKADPKIDHVPCPHVFACEVLTTPERGKGTGENNIKNHEKIW